MMRSTTCDLITWTITYDDIQQEVHEETSKTVFCKVGSISRQEWMDAGRIGVRPQYKLTLPIANYNGEVIVDFEGKRYEVYRSYCAGDQMDLYVELKGGSDGIQRQD